jgi:hypothetical protein
MVKIVKSILCIFIIILLAAGCATIVSGTSQTITFQSNPQGAQVLIDGLPVGITPLSIKVKKNDNTTVQLKLDGYETQIFKMQTEFDPMFFGNILIGGFLGSTTDAVSGATVEYSPDAYYTTLMPIGEKTVLLVEREETMVIRFILVNYNAISLDLARGQGEYLDALYDMLEFPDGEGDAVLTKIKKLFAENEEIPDFAEAVSEELGTTKQ